MSLLLASSRGCGDGEMPPGTADGQVWLWDASAGAWVLRVLTAADVGALPDSYAPAWGDVTGKPATYPPASHSHSWSSLTNRPFDHAFRYTWGLSGYGSAWTFNATVSSKFMSLILIRAWKGNGAMENILAMTNHDDHALQLSIIEAASNFTLTVISPTQLSIRNNSGSFANIHVHVLGF
jgi:hypothetical protein